MTFKGLYTVCVAWCEANAVSFLYFSASFGAGVKNAHASYGFYDI